MERILSIDVGTNTVLGAVGELGPGGLAIVSDEERIVGLGRGVDRNRTLRPDRIAAALGALEEHRDRARALGVTRTVAAGTSALRDAENRDAFLLPARALLGAAVEVVSGEREAQLTFHGAFVGLPTPARALVVDIGGGSTELVWSDGPAIERRVSLDVGSVRLFERLLRSDPPTSGELDALDAALDAALSPLPPPEARAVWMLAGTASSTAMLVRGQIGSTHGAHVSRAEAEHVAGALAVRTTAERRRLPGMIEARADVVVAGVRILCAVLRWADADGCGVSEGGVRHGLLREAFGV